MPVSFFPRKNRFKRVLSLCALCLMIGFIVLSGTDIGAAVYQYTDENGNVGYTDAPTDTRYKYTPVGPSEEGLKKEEVLEKEEKAEPKKQAGEPKIEPKVEPKKKDVGGKEGMMEQIKELEKARDAAADERQRKMLETEIDGLKHLLEDYDKANKDWSG
jgi:hypothetical protein